MDMMKFERCHKFFTRGLLQDRKYTYAIKRFYTDKALFHSYFDMKKHLANMTDDFRIEGTYGNKLTTGPKKGQRRKFLVHFLPGTSNTTFGKRPAMILQNYMTQHSIDRLFLVTPVSVTNHALKQLREVADIEIWPMIDCLTQAENHYTVPPSRKVTAKERREFYTRYKINGGNLPRILMGRRVVRYWGFSPGDLIAIERRTHAGVVNEFRVVVNG